MTRKELYESLEDNPVIAAVRDSRFEEALESPSSVIFLLGGNLLNVAERIVSAKKAGKKIFVHIDLSEGIGRDRSGLEYLLRQEQARLLDAEGADAARQEGGDLPPQHRSK